MAQDVDKFLEALALGMTEGKAAAYAGISMDRVERLKRRSSMVAKIEKAQAEWEHRALSLLWDQIDQAQDARLALSVWTALTGRYGSDDGDVDWMVSIYKMVRDKTGGSDR